MGKGLKTKAELVKRVSEYIRTGKDKHIVDPDPDKIYSRRKERLSTFTDVSGEEGILVQFPETVGALRSRKCQCLPESK